MIKFRQRVSRNVLKLLVLVWFLIPFIPVALLWEFLNPVGFWQSLVMLFICAIFYIAFLVAEFVLAMLLGDLL